MRPFLSIIIAVALSISASYFLFKNNSTPTIQNTTKIESALERVMRTKTLRCGYIILPPEFNKDPNTGKFSGISYDITQAIAKRLGLNVEWTEEVSFVTMGAAIKSNRFDAICFSLYRYAPQAAIMDYSDPLFATPTYAYVRSNDDRFDNDITLANHKDITIATVDGEASHFIAQDDFRNAKLYSLPQMSSLTDMLVAVETGKADIAFSNAAVVMPYFQHNPGKLKIANPHNPLRIYSHGLVVRKGQTDLLNTLNIAINEMTEHGELDRILDKWHKVPGMIYRVQLPYKKEMLDLNKVSAE